MAQSQAPTPSKLIMDDLATYAGTYVLPTHRAREVLLRFVDGEDVSSLGEWDQL